MYGAVAVCVCVVSLTNQMKIIKGKKMETILSMILEFLFGAAQLVKVVCVSALFSLVYKMCAFAKQIILKEV